MTPGQTLKNAHRPSKSKKRKTAQTVEDVDQGGEITERRAQQIASGILNIQWLKRMGRAKWWGLAGEQIITLTSVLPVRVQWKNTSTYQYQLSDPQHEELLHLCKCVRVLEPNFQRAADGQ